MGLICIICKSMVPCSKFVCACVCLCTLSLADMLVHMTSESAAPSFRVSPIKYFPAPKYTVAGFCRVCVSFCALFNVLNGSVFVPAPWSFPFGETYISVATICDFGDTQTRSGVSVGKSTAPGQSPRFRASWRDADADGTYESQCI